ncbi:NAD(+) synthase, partial [bacterium]|nr:NAD(+) synthase [bacterium]
MDNGFIKVASGTHRISVGDVGSNVTSLLEVIDATNKQKVKVLVTPELGITGYTLGDLFYFDNILSDSINGLMDLAKATKNTAMLIFVGLPVRKDNKIYNTAAALYKGDILGFVPKSYLPNYSEFYEKRQFNPAPDKLSTIIINGKEYPFGTNILFRCKSLSEFCVGCEICEDLWVTTPPSNSHAINGANIIVNLSASNETVSKADYRRSLVCSQSARLACGYVYSDAGEGESTTDVVFAGHNLIAENGKLLKETQLFENGLIVSEIDVKFLAYEKSRLFNYQVTSDKEYLTVYFDMPIETTKLTREYKKTPFVPEQEGELNERAKLILTMQAMGLKKRLEHTKSKCVVFGISGGLDSCLTLLVAVKTMKLLNRPLSDIIAVTMPCFGTTDRTYKNACKLSNAYGVTLKEINIKKSVLQHFADIGHDGSTDITYENAQARERTQVLMDVANQNGGFVLGTGDLSELALGWATYNGDHMSMYATNSSIPKTLVRHL